MMCCENCGKRLGERLVTAFGEVMCEDCWDEYICTPVGRVEYILGIARGDYPATEFDDDFLKEVSASWEENKAAIRAIIPSNLWAIANMKAQIFSKL